MVTHTHQKEKKKQNTKQNKTKKNTAKHTTHRLFLVLYGYHQFYHMLLQLIMISQNSTPRDHHISSLPQILYRVYILYVRHSHRLILSVVTDVSVASHDP